MMRFFKSLYLLFSCLAYPIMGQTGSLTNSLSMEYRYFIDDKAFAEQEKQYAAIAFNSEFDRSFASGQKLGFELFARLDQHDDERNHIDIAELYWTLPSDNWELLVGINKVFWGVTESVHLVDIINQTDQVESFDGEDKLGQAMILLNTFHDWGNIDFYLLPAFRERSYAGIEGRLRLPLIIDTDSAVYESSDEDSHIDYALRWSHTFDIWDIGISYFDGTSRAPDFQLQANRLVPFYPLMTQLGIDLQATTESWLWKLEAIRRQASRSDDYIQAAFGFEYTFVGVNDSDVDVGIVMEYLYDDRDEVNGQALLNPFENDVLVATRIALNDVQSSEILAGFIADLDQSSYSFSIEASRRLGNKFKLELESRLFNNIDSSDALGFIKQDSYIEADLTYYF